MAIKLIQASDEYKAIDLIAGLSVVSNPRVSTIICGKTQVSIIALLMSARATLLKTQTVLEIIDKI
ncbi:hypothetical protein [Spirosoma knui]